MASGKQVEYQTFNRPTQDSYDWADFNDSRINATEIGSPCLRYVLRVPDGHRDMDLRDQGLYSFSAFGLRKDIGGEIRQKVRSKKVLHGRDLVAYCADFERPMDSDFFGVTTPGVFNFEILDQYQQKPSLVGAAHLHMHSPNFRGSLIVGFNGDGSIMYVEAKQGERTDHDSVLAYRDRVEIKLGSHLTGMKRDEEYIFGVPRWAFSEDISAKFIVQKKQPNLEPIEMAITTDPELEIGRKRLGHPMDPHSFANRHQAYLVTTAFAYVNPFSQDFDFIAESSTLGEVSTQMTVTGEDLTVTLSNKEGQHAKYSGNVTLIERLSEGLELLKFTNPEHLTIDLVSDYAEYIFLKLHLLLLARQGYNIRLTHDIIPKQH